MDPSGTVAPALPLGLMPLEQRRVLRFPISEETSCHLVAAVGETQWPARVVDVSADGVCLLLRRRFETGTRVVLELAHGVRVFSRTVELRVVHVTETEDGAFVLGGAFSRKLSHAELTALLS